MKTLKHRRRVKPHSVGPVVRQSWRDHEMMSVVGCIDDKGAITARPCKEIGGHRPEEHRGKRWRWLVWSQEYIHIGPGRVDELTTEETFSVCDWLIRHGYADERCLPNK